MFHLQKLARPSIIRTMSMSTYKRTSPLSKGFNIHWPQNNMRIKEKVISTEKALVVLGICTVAIMLPSPTSCYDGVTEIDCLNNFEEPFDSH